MKINFSFLILLIIFFLISGGITWLILNRSQKPPPPFPVEEEKILNIFNWENYLSENVIEEFEKKFNVKVNIDTFEDSSQMFSTIQFQPDKYDLVVMEDDYLQLMKRIKLLSPLDHQKIPNLKNLNEASKNNSYDPGNQYCVPYVAGYTGIVINEKLVDDFDGTRKVLWDPKYKGKISMPNNAIEILINGFLALGYDFQNLTTQQLKDAKDFALLQKDFVLGYDDPMSQRELLVEEKAWIGYIYSTEVLDIIKRNPNLKFFAPKEGVLLWSDNWCIPKDSPHKNLAHQFLNYLLDPKIAAKNSQDIGALMLVKGMEEFLDPEFLVQTKGLDFPQEREIFQKSSYRTKELLGEEFQIIANELATELEIEE